MLSRTTRREKPVRRGTRRRSGEERARPTGVGPEPERRDLDRAQDTAVYSCACGMVFEDSVSTSVSCPHCGSSQAW